jgi:hypothetical protein
MSAYSNSTTSFHTLPQRLFQLVCAEGKAPNGAALDAALNAVAHRRTPSTAVIYGKGVQW